MKVYRDIVENGVLVSKEIFNIAECTYTGKDMGERSITATIYFATPIDFQIGDYIKLPMQNLIRSTSGVNGSIASGSGEVEKFYIYTMPTMKKVARAMENGKAFEHTVTFYPAQYELSCVQMRDLGNSLSADEIIYTGFDSVSFNGGAKELMDRIMMVLKEAYHDSDGNPLWSYEISDSVNEEKNLALERFPISFSGNTVMDALLELNNKETINTTFFINNRKIYVGFKRPYFCRVTDGMSIDTNPSSQLFTFQYGKTSDKGVALQYGGLYDITKSVGKEVPITKLFAYGASRNLNRYYCSDRVKGGRYVNRLMLPSFDTDGKTDFIISEDALQRYGVREATKQFEEIYPSIRYATYDDIRQVKYCIKVKASGVKNENIDSPSYSVARIQCYKIVEGEIKGVNKLVEAAPPDDLAIYIHAMDKVVKVVLYGGATNAEAIAKQRQHDTKVPTYTSGGSDYIPGSCFIIHDRGFDEPGTVYENANRSAWFTNIDNLSGFTEKQKEEIKLNQINYTDTFWLTDLYIFQAYNQTYFSRDGYSAWSWARLNNKYTSSEGHIASDSVVVNEIVHVEPITLADTSMTAAGIDKPQQTFDIYLRDLGFTINEQNDFGEMVFILNGTVKVSILDGLLAGQEFEISGSINSTSPSCICAFNDDGTRNEAFFAEPDYTQDGANPQTPYDAFNKGAIWRVRLNRTNVDDPDYSNLNLAMPTKEINAKSGDHLVLLDLFMPDIYIHAAENRLLREARKYLEANDNGSISYSVNFDKVRLQQIPNYAMQLREGLNLRLVDEDLNIRTENNGRYIADYRTNPIYSQRELADGKNSDWVSTVAPIDFTRSKHYTIELSIFNSSEFDINDFKFALFKTKNDNNTSFEPEYSVEQTENGMDIILTIKFQLPDNFDDGQLYYPSAYLCKLKSWYNIVDMYLISVFERDYAENEEVLNYADFTIDSLTVKITDNSGNNEPIREITATLSEQTNATAWATLMNKVATTAKEGEQNKKALEEVVNTARRNYQALLSLKNSIFDPDGSCDQTFLQVMMQQVGADSMNYQLDKTRSGIGSDGQPTLFNCSCERGSDDYYHFRVYNDDTLRHYVYTQGSQAGNWEIPVGANGVDVQLNGTESYFVCLKCPKNDTVGQWICSTKQYAVNDPEDDTCWFFNWAILTVDSGGVYTLMETRGNAYMYGDNLVCGKISTMAGNSYFDLTHGNFVLGDGTDSALSYINGVLTISGSKGDAEKTLRQLGILEGKVDTAQSTANEAAQAAEEAKNMEIGGRNLLLQTDLNQYIDKWSVWQSSKVLSNGWCKVTQNSGASSVGIITPKESDGATIENGHSYILSFDCYLDTSALVDSIKANYCYLMFSSGGNNVIGNYAIINKTPRRVSIPFTFSSNITEKFGVMIGCRGTNIPAFYIKDVKLEKGTKATDWTPAPEDVDAAIEKAGYVNMYDGGDISKSYKSEDYIMSQVLCSIYSGTYKTSAVENNGFDEYKEPFNASTLVVVKSGQGSFLNGVAALYNYRDAILGTYYWGNDITVNEGVDIVVFFAQKDYIDYCISSYNEYGAEMPSGGSGIWTIKDIKIITDNATAFQIAQSKAEALDYLKAALTDGSTEIAGGLTMTNVLMLKNLEGDVTAGMSGLTKHNNLEDKVLIWGGCTYEEAYAAANNDTYNTGSGTVTTLLKKDGTGKIGIFKISDTKVVVDVPNQGKVIIDASEDSGGVRVLNTNNQEKVIISPKSIEPYMPKEDKVVIQKTVTITSNDNKYPYKYFVTGAPQGATCTTSLNVTFDLKEHFSSVTDTFYCKFNIKIYGRLTQVLSNSTYPSNGSVSMQFNLNGTYLQAPMSNSISQNTWGYEQNGIDPEQYYMEINKDSSYPMVNYTFNEFYLVPNPNMKLNLHVHGDNCCLYNLTGDITIELTVTRLNSYGYIPKTIVGSDGILSAYDNKKYFMVKNTSKEQQIYAKGLGTSGDSGQLIKKSGAYKAFAQSLVQFMHQYIKADAKESGFSNALDALAEDLPDDVFITAVE